MGDGVSLIQRGALFRHAKTNHTYVVLGLGVIEDDMTPAVIYTRWGRLATTKGPDIEVGRPLAEFEDGRFRHAGWDFDYARSPNHTGDTK